MTFVVHRFSDRKAISKKRLFELVDGGESRHMVSSPKLCLSCSLSDNFCADSTLSQVPEDPLFCYKGSLDIIVNDIVDISGVSLVRFV